MLYCLPLEPMEERYTEQWYRWFQEDCEQLNVPCTYIAGERLGTTVEVGTVLDAAGTNYWKFMQLARVCQLFKHRLVKDGDIFFTMDMWHPGLEAIPYMATLYGLDIKVGAFLHAGSYTDEDFAAPMANWANYFEHGWATLCDWIFVGSQYHKSTFVIRRFGDPKNIYVHGNPTRSYEMPALNLQPRENIIIFSNRWDNEKRPQTFVKMMCHLWYIRQDFQVVVTTSRAKFRSNNPDLLHILDDVPFPVEVKVGLSKQEYYQELNKAKVFVTTSIEENFGYCLVEAMIMGVSPIAREGLSHEELAPTGQLFRFPSQGAALCSYRLDNPFDPSYLRLSMRRFDYAFTNMIMEMTSE